MKHMRFLAAMLCLLLLCGCMRAETSDGNGCEEELYTLADDAGDGAITMETGETAANGSEPYSVQGAVFTYNGKEHALAEQDANINAIADVRSAGQYIVIDGHAGPKHGIYCIFDTDAEAFVKSFPGTNLVWRGDDLSTAIYSFWSDVLDFEGNILTRCELTGSAFIRELGFSADGETILVNIVSDDGSDWLETYSLAGERLS